MRLQDFNFSMCKGTKTLANTNVYYFGLKYTFGPAASRLLEAYKMLLKFLGNLQNLRDSHAALASGSETSGGPSSVSAIISECESEMTVINRDLGILSASIAREQAEKMSI
ncbi:AUGMIN subunit 7-like [Vicia villosa]|uniref:AUGMIN subunit 7-like n=1 Tax=Vicia villosa TaxID=3911 RepID=UPI00273BE106|nr:AUGMIN subunit 7-like [Vicia villosa]